MAKPDHIPRSLSPEHGDFLRPERVRYRDGEITYLFRSPGDRLLLGRGSSHEHAGDMMRPHGVNLAIVRTTGGSKKDGNTYGIGGGYVINYHDQDYHVLLGDQLEVVIDTPAVLGAWRTSNVESVELRGGIDSACEVAEAREGPNPFPYLQHMIEAINRERGL